jgi:hypothetical protein
MVHIRIDKDVMDFIRKQANKEMRSRSGMINKYLSDQKNRTENKERKDNE